jgi:ferrous iron transport protein B
MQSQTIALLGNPNCGKTTLFNALTGAKQYVGNWPGVTVDRKEGQYRYGQKTITVVDLPGIYAIDPEDGSNSIDEAIARDYLLSGNAQVVVNIVDASNLERNLYLTTQILEMGLPLVVALNMVDAAEERGILINPPAMAERLGCPVVPLIAARGEGVAALQNCVDDLLNGPYLPKAQVIYPAVIEDAIAAIIPSLALSSNARLNRWKALKLLEYDDAGISKSVSGLLTRVAEQRHHIHHILGEDIDIIVADSRYSYAHQLVNEVATRPRHISTTQSDRIDQVVLNRWLGIPIFLGVMYLLFMFAINVGSAFIDFFDILFGAIFVEGFGRLLAAMGTPAVLNVVLADGMGGGIQTVATFIPVIACLFLFMAFLEDSGYMARAAFVMDRFMRFVGLPGKSFVPMLVGFGCNVPAIMASRTLESRRDRILTIMMNPFMSCGARLPVYALFAAVFFPVAGQNIVFALYLMGMAMAIVTGLIMKHTLLKGKSVPFVMELPAYHMPTLKGILIRTWERLKSFIVDAGKIIIIMVMVLSLLNSIGTDGSVGNQDSQNSILSAAGQTITPAFAPMGISQENWPATVGIFTGVFAKEAIVGTLDSLYTQMGQAEAAAAGLAPADESVDLMGRIGEAFATIPANLASLAGSLLDPLGLSVGDLSNAETTAAAQAVAYTTFGQMVQRFDGRIGALAYLLFVLMYMPCVAAMGAIYRETNAGWSSFIGLWTTALAYWSAVMFYQVGTFSQHPGSATLWITGLTLGAMAAIGALRFARPAQRKRHLSLEGN